MKKPTMQLEVEFDGGTYILGFNEGDSLTMAKPTHRMISIKIKPYDYVEPPPRVGGGSNLDEIVGGWK